MALTVYVVQSPNRRVHASDVGRSGYTREDVGKMRPVFDLSPARKFGQLQVMLPSEPVGDAQPFVDTMREILVNFTPDDYLLPLGDPALMGAAVALAAIHGNGCVRVLRWDRYTRGYQVVEIDLRRK
jgi:hypothetical protein